MKSRKAALIDLFEKHNHCAVSVEKRAAVLLLRSDLASVNNLPRAKRTGTIQAIKELDALIASTSSLIDRIDGLHRTALDSIDDGQPLGQHDAPAIRPIKFKNDLQRLKQAALNGRKSFGSARTKRTGRPKDRHADSITDAAELAFIALTSKTPTKKHGFHQFLAEVLSIVRPDVKPEGQLRGLEKRRKK